MTPTFTVSLDLSMLTFICKINLPTAFSTAFEAMCNNDIFLSFFAEVCLCSYIWLLQHKDLNKCQYKCLLNKQFESYRILGLESLKKFV